MNAHLSSHELHAPSVILFGLDDMGKAHASSFSQGDAKLAQKAASLMSMRLLPIESDSVRALAARLPRGKIFASGKGFVPFVKAALYADIVAAAPEDTVAEPIAELPSPDGESETTNRPTPVSQPVGWHDIKPGSIVLSAAFPGEMDWYECVVISADDEDQFTLQYCDWPQEPTFVRRMSEIGLLHPLYTAEPPLAAG